jgi:hypothetical protein
MAKIFRPHNTMPIAHLVLLRCTPGGGIHVHELRHVYWVMNTTQSYATRLADAQMHPFNPRLDTFLAYCVYRQSQWFDQLQNEGKLYGASRSD